MRGRLFEHAAIAGFAELPVTRTAEQSTRDLIAEVVSTLLVDTGLSTDAVDGLAVGSFTLPPDHAANLARWLGLEVRWLAPQEPGGVGALSAVMAAARAVEAGDADVVLCVGADALDTDSLRRLSARFSREVADWLAPVGAHSANAIFALLQDRYMHDFDVTRADIGRVAVHQRSLGARNPLALFTEPLTLEEYLSAPPVAAPIHLFDCVHPGSGAGAVIVTRTDEAPGPTVPILGGGEAHHHARAPSARTLGWRSFVPELLAALGLAHDDIDVLQLYDDYPVMVLWQLEELGFCERGSAATFVRATDLTPEGPLSLNTGGGMLACGQAGAAGGYVPLIEGARQAAGQAAQRQRGTVDHILVSGLGMISYGFPLSVGALVLGGSVA